MRSSLSQRDIRTIFRKARRVYQGPGLDLLLYPSPVDTGRLLVVTSRKIGSAPQRNRVRRRLKAIFHEEQLGIHGIDCIAIIKKPGISYSFDQLKELLCSVFAAK